jgi:hypothetical protein
MYGTVARYRLKPGMEQKLLALEAEFREAKVPGIVAEYVYRMDKDSLACIEVAVFESKEAYFALANSPDQDARYRKLLEIIEGDPEWNDGEVIVAYTPMPHET